MVGPDRPGMPRIKKEQIKIDAKKALELLGADFRGDHVAGMAEWLKNAVDAYIRDDVPDAEQHIVIHLRTVGKKSDWQFECIDFVGATFDDVNDSLMVWCDPNAASRGKHDVFGGHGNGGKFHMQQNFRTSIFWTYRDGKLTAFGFDPEKDYGFLPKYRGTDIEPRRALKEAGLDLAIVPKEVRERFERGDIRFSVVRGFGPEPPPKWRNWEDFIEKLRRNGQAKQLLDRCPITVAVNGKIAVEDLDAPKIPAKPGFEKPFAFDIPARIPFDGEDVIFAKDGSAPGTLTLRVAADPFSPKGADAVLNAIDIKGKVGVIASYRIIELGVGNFLGAQFIYGECRCPVLEQLGLKQNDRKRLADNDWSLALLRWIGERVDEVAGKLIQQADKEKADQQSAVTRRFNALLNKWKNQFLDKLFVEVPVGAGAGPGFGGTGGGGSGGNGHGGGGGGGRGGEDGTGGGGEGQQGKRKAPKYPLVLVSGVDPDPDTGNLFKLDPRHPVVYQRPEDVGRNLWWINHQRPLAERLMAGGPTSERYRDYLLQRYVDILQTYLVSQRWRETVTADVENVTDWMIEAVGRIHDAAGRDLEDFLFGKAARDGEAALA